MWLLVKTAEDLAKHRTTRTGLFAQIRQVSAVESVTDMSAISRRTLDTWLGDWFLPDDQVLLPEMPSKTRKARRNGRD